MNKLFWKNIFLSFGLVSIVAVLGTVFVNLGMEWFDNTNKPSQWIPNFVIPIVWTIIYLAFALAIFSWLQQGKQTAKVVLLLIINGVLNILWSLIFFTFNLTFLGLVIILINSFFALVLTITLKNEKLPYFQYLYIYPIWLSIATSLNTAIWILN